MGKSFPPTHFLLKATRIILVHVSQESDTKSLWIKGRIFINISRHLLGSQKPVWIKSVNQKWKKMNPGPGWTSGRDSMIQSKEWRPEPQIQYLPSETQLLGVKIVVSPFWKNNYQPPLSPKPGTTSVVLQALPCFIDLSKGKSVWSPKRDNFHVAGSILCSISS